MLNKSRRRIVSAAAALTTALLMVAGTAHGSADWSYSGATGPGKWATLDPAYALCADGSVQTPINIVKPAARGMKDLGFEYLPGEAEIFNNGHTVEAEPGADSLVSNLNLDGYRYELKQFHFHAPSEHAINGKKYPLEIHFVHKAANGDLAVVGIFVKKGKANAAWVPFVKNIASATAEPADTKVELDWEAMLPKNRQTIRYIGSLTTPPCSQGVRWNVFSHPIEMSAQQINKFKAAYSNNSRPIRPLNNRPVMIDSSPDGGGTWAKDARNW